MFESWLCVILFDFSVCYDFFAFCGVVGNLKFCVFVLGGVACVLLRGFSCYFAVFLGLLLGFDWIV